MPVSPEAIITDLTTDYDKERLIEEFILMENGGHWRIFALTDERTHCFIFNMNTTTMNLRGILKISYHPYVEPEKSQTEPGVFSMPDSSRFLSSRVNALFRVKAQEPRMSVAQLKELIVESRMHDYLFARVDPKDSREGVAGCRWWTISLLGELEMERRVPTGTANAVVNFIQERSDALKLQQRELPSEQIKMPTTKGVFPTAKLNYNW